jgi:ribonuclease HI
VRNTITHATDKLSFVGSKKFLLKYWTELCGIRHQGKYHDSKDKLPYAESLVTEKKRRQDRTPDKWEPPPEGWLMINVDGAFDERTGEGGTGVVIRDHTGKITLTAWSFFQGGGSAEEAELLACREGIHLAADWCPGSMLLVTDCSPVAAMLSSSTGNRSSHKFLIDEIVEVGHRLPRWTVVHKRRDCNSAAHELAQLAKRTRHSAVWHYAAPACVEQIIARECNTLSE